MSDAPRPLINCHVHTFTSEHVPLGFPHPAVAWLRHAAPLLPLLGTAVGVLNRDWGDQLFRLHRFHHEAARGSQARIFEELRRHYPPGTRFVVLPMDFGPSGHGRVPKDLRRQHDELAELAADPVLGPSVIPFATAHPGSAASVAEAERALSDLGFRGLKIYPPLGYAPDAEPLMSRLYPALKEGPRPLMVHCSTGGVRRSGWSSRDAAKVTRPDRIVPVLEAFPDVPVCLAHFGGHAEWLRYLEDGVRPGDAGAVEENWMLSIRAMIGSGRWDNLWTDISYTLFRYERLAPVLRLFLEAEDEWGERLRARTLFGSDWYMTRKEALSEREVSIRLRVALGPVFERIAVENPRAWLGPALDASGAIG